MMKGKKDVLGRAGTTRDCRILYAVVIGVTFGAFWAYLRPHGLLQASTTSPLVSDRRTTKVS